MIIFFDENSTKKTQKDIWYLAWSVVILTFCNIVCCPFRHLSSSSSKIEIYMVIFDSGFLFLFSSWVKNQIYKAFITTVKSILPTWKNENFIGIFSTSYRKVTFSLTDTQKPILICDCSIMILWLSTCLVSKMLNFTVFYYSQNEKQKL